MIQIHYPSDSSETKAALQLRKLIQQSWPDIADHPREVIHIVTSAQAHGQQRADNDVLVMFNLDEPREYQHKTGIYDEKGGVSFPKASAIKSLMMTVEVKDHPETNIAFSGSSVRVRYKERWADATAQSLGQKNGLINHLKRQGAAYPPIIANAIWLRELSDEKLPSPPHAVLGKNATWDDFLTVAANSNPLMRQMNAERLIVSSQKRDGAIDKALDVFARDMTTMEGVPSVPVKSRGFLSTISLYIPGAPRRKGPEIEAKPPRLVVDDAVDALCEISLAHARRHVIASLAAADGIAKRTRGDHPFSEISQARSATIDLLKIEHAEEQTNQPKRTELLGEAIGITLSSLSHVATIDPATERPLARQASFLRSARRMLDYVEIEKGRITTLSDSKALRSIRDIGMPEISADAGLIVAWEGYRALAVVKSTTPAGMKSLDDMRTRLCTIADMEVTQRRSEETLRVLMDQKIQLDGVKVQHPVLSRFVGDARENVEFAKKWLMASASGERPAFFGSEREPYSGRTGFARKEEGRRDVNRNHSREERNTAHDLPPVSENPSPKSTGFWGGLERNSERVSARPHEKIEARIISRGPDRDDHSR